MIVCTVMIQAVGYCETSLHMYQATIWHNIPDELIFMVTVLRTNILHTSGFTGTHCVAQVTIARGMEMGLAEGCKKLTFWQQEWPKCGYRGDRQGASGYLPTSVFGQGHPGLIIGQAFTAKVLSTIRQAATVSGKL